MEKEGEELDEKQKGGTMLFKKGTQNKKKFNREREIFFLLMVEGVVSAN